MNHYTTTNSPDYLSYPINTGLDGQFSCYCKYLNRILNLMIETVNMPDGKRFLFIRFDVRFPQFGYHVDGGNREIRHLMKMLTQNSDNNGYGFRYAWVWEKEPNNPHHHYHCIALLNYDKVFNYRGFLNMVSHAWNHVLGNADNKGLINFCDKDRGGNPVENGILIQRPSDHVHGAELLAQQQRFQDQFNRCYHWASYLAKVEQKGRENRPPRVRGFGCSQSC
ncbi:MAG: hypothetical protein CL942_11140 [Desulfovibrio sp.]|nr:hypothetical protein [Desulfovibrio sp.]|tara:strand:- start:24281 stop:24949 length:669 start_codon:yes stop_codon:yes gene_type:complete